MELELILIHELEEDKRRGQGLPEKWVWLAVPPQCLTWPGAAAGGKPHQAGAYRHVSCVMLNSPASQLVTTQCLQQLAHGSLLRLQKLHPGRTPLPRPDLKQTHRTHGHSEVLTAIHKAQTQLLQPDGHKSEMRRARFPGPGTHSPAHLAGVCGEHS